MLSIRKFENKDYENVQYVCLHSEEGHVDPPDLQEFVLHTFCDYYIDNEPENCFVLDDDGKAVGYVICAENYDKYKQIFDEKYLPLNKHLDEGLYRWAVNSTVLQKKYKESFPAHLHIDLLPQYQRKGYGGKLINALFDHLKNKGVCGVMLTAGPQNETGVNFYKKYGFQLLEETPEDVAFGMKLL